MSIAIGGALGALGDIVEYLNILTGGFAQRYKMICQDKRVLILKAACTISSIGGWKDERYFGVKKIRIAERFNLDPSAITRLYSKGQVLLDADEKLKRKLLSLGV